MIRHPHNDCAPSVRSPVTQASVLVGSILSLAISIGISTQSITLGSRDGNWVYPYIRPFSERSIAVALVAAVIVVVLAAVPPSLADRHEWRIVMAWLLVGLLLQALCRSLTPITFGDIFVSDGANSFYSVARRYSVH